MESTSLLDSLKIKSIEIFAETDVSERGYIHGGTPGYAVTDISNNEVNINTSFYYELTTEINIPGILIAEKDVAGNIWQAQLALHPTAVRSGLNINFSNRFTKIQNKAVMLKQIPITVYINGQLRTILPTNIDETAQKNKGISVLPHCFMSQEIFLQ